MNDLRQRIDDRTARVAVIGLGYVGLPLGFALAKAGYRVIGVDRDPVRVSQVANGVCPIGSTEPGLDSLAACLVLEGWLHPTVDPAALQEAQVVLVCVETPVDAVTKQPNYSALRDALQAVGVQMRPGSLVIIESTLAPLTMMRVVEPALRAASGLVAGQDYHLAHCPERVSPGHLLANLREVPRVIGGWTLECGELAATLYRQISSADLHLTDCLTAEVTKCAENAYRDVNIAFANEVALLCEDLGADAWQVRRLVNTCPGRDMLEPGPGVGGACIPKDPWLLIAHPRQYFVFAGGLVREARRLNDAMPAHVLELLRDALAEAGRSLAGSDVVILGRSYREGIGDVRNSPSAALQDLLTGTGARAWAHDPYLSCLDADWRQAVKGADAVVLMVAHEEYRAIDLAELRALLRTPVLVDGRGIFDPEVARRAGLIYRGVGRP